MCFLSSQASDDSSTVNASTNPIVVPKIESKANDSTDNGNGTADADNCLHLDSLS